MLKEIMLFSTLLILPATSAPAQPFETDLFPTAAAELKIGFIGHGSLLFDFAGKVIHVDPYGKLADYKQLPKADLILLTHEHRDHLDPQAIAAVSTSATEIVATASCAEQLGLPQAMKNGDIRDWNGIRIEAVPAYNLLHKRDTGEPFHPRGSGNGYLLNFADKRVYVAGDTENIPEMKALQQIDIAFLPMNLPYTMTPEMVADAARAFKPKILYPYHFGETDPARLVELLRDTPEIEVRIRRMQ